jgi:competence protein ComGC
MQTDVKIAQESGEEHAPMNLSGRSFNDGAEMHGCAKSSPPTGCHIAIIPRLHRGFTVVQLLTILTVIAVLAAMMVSVFSRGLATARHSQCDTHLKDLTIVLNEFRTENGHFPKRLMDLRSKGYIQDDSALHCPADPAEQSSYGEYYAIRASRDGNDRPILVCPYHELDGSEGHASFQRSPDTARQGHESGVAGCQRRDRATPRDRNPFRHAAAWKCAAATLSAPAAAARPRLFLPMAPPANCAAAAA